MDFQNSTFLLRALKCVFGSFENVKGKNYPYQQGLRIRTERMEKITFAYLEVFQKN